MLENIVTAFYNELTVRLKLRFRFALNTRAGVSSAAWEVSASQKRENCQKFRRSQHINAGLGEDADADHGR